MGAEPLIGRPQLEKSDAGAERANMTSGGLGAGEGTTFGAAGAG